MSRWNGRTASKITGHSSKYCFLKKVSLLLVVLKNSKQNNWTYLKVLLLEEGKLAVGGTSIACVVSHHYSGFWYHAGLV